MHRNGFIIVMCCGESSSESTLAFLRSRLASRSSQRVRRSAFTVIILARRGFLRSQIGKGNGYLPEETERALALGPGVSLWFLMSFAGTTTDGVFMFHL